MNSFDFYFDLCILNGVTLKTFELCSQGHFICALFSFLSPYSLTPVNKTSYCCFKVESELKRLAHSEVPESSEGKGALVMKVKQTLIGQLKTLLFNNTSDIGGGEQVRTLFNKFQDAVFKVGEKTIINQINHH